MSIVRWGEADSNVYIIGFDDKWECVGCDGLNALATYEDFLQHLKWHRERDHVVPDFVETRLKDHEDWEASGMSWEDWHNRAKETI